MMHVVSAVLSVLLSGGVNGLLLATDIAARGLDIPRFWSHRVSKNRAKLFLSEHRQISTNFDNFLAERWQRS